MPRPLDCEFSKQTIIEALKRADFKCERCGIAKEETVEGYLFAHHILGVADAVKYHPEVAHSIINSLANLRILCKKCHSIEDAHSRKHHNEIAHNMLAYRPARV